MNRLIFYVACIVVISPNLFRMTKDVKDIKVAKLLQDNVNDFVTKMLLNQLNSKCITFSK